ncbi:GNAT family N-acetyltransferase [Oerskovia sp. Sa1BUA8]|uniref:GNAT family N-acetyltransferase n=2 Tax=Oerskovia douganii TaxID=2762210 RepID=A0A9D5UAG5_9CELL|nr:GNAT family N-acetyltransferase [Oerskovia douganii]
MVITLSTPNPSALHEMIEVLASWQQENKSLQLHPGDLGWAWQIGASELAGRVRTWAVNGRPVALGYLDGGTLLRLAIAPDAENDQELASRMADDVADPSRGVLPGGPVAVEARLGGVFRSRLLGAGWQADELWTPMIRDLVEPVPRPDVRIEEVGPELAHAQALVHRASFESSRFTDERWHTMTTGPAYAAARCLLAYDAQGSAVATATVWSAGEGRPGVLEPLGVHRDHRGHGYGRAIALAAASALQEMGASSATVCAESSNVGAVATYSSAGFQSHPEVADLVRVG